MNKRKSATSASLHHVGIFHGAEMAVLAPLIRSTDFNPHVISECAEKGLIPLSIANALNAAGFVARTVLAAQLAQRTYGVPASVLMAVGIYRSGTTVEDLIEDADRAVEWPGCDCCYSPMIRKWFMDFAAGLVGSARGREALRLLPGREFVIKRPVLKLYVRALGVAGFWDSLESEDIISNIERYDLDECDRAAIFAPGCYERATYKEAARDGGTKLVPVWADLLGPSIQTAPVCNAKVSARVSRPTKSKAVRRSTAKGA
jgi:hypothetical protein